MGKKGENWWRRERGQQETDSLSKRAKLSKVIINKRQQQCRQAAYRGPPGC